MALELLISKNKIRQIYLISFILKPVFVQIAKTFFFKVYEAQVMSTGYFL
jgi:hypothetical protein